MVELKCRVAGCDNVEKEGTTIAEAIDLLKFHVAAVHGQGGEEAPIEKRWTVLKLLKSLLKLNGTLSLMTGAATKPLRMW